MDYHTVRYTSVGRIATITLNRPHRMNAISMDMPGEIAHAVVQANRDDSIHAIVLAGEGKGFCSGYDLVDFAEQQGEQPGSQLGGGAGDGGRGGDWLSAGEGMGVSNTQMFATLFDGITRHSPEGVWFAAHRVSPAPIDQATHPQCRITAARSASGSEITSQAGQSLGVSGCSCNRVWARQPASRIPWINFSVRKASNHW
jgi:hypothetical protein